LKFMSVGVLHRDHGREKECGSVTFILGCFCLLSAGKILNTLTHSALSLLPPPSI